MQRVGCASQLRFDQPGLDALTTRHLERFAIEIQSANDFVWYELLVWRDRGE